MRISEKACIDRGSRGNHDTCQKGVKMKRTLKNILVGLIVITCIVTMGYQVTDAKKAKKVVLKSVSAVSANTISVNWKKVYGAKRYEIFCSSDGEGFEKIGSARSTNYIHKKLDLGTQYEYKVRAVLPKGKKTSYSNIKGTKTKGSAYLLGLEKPYNQEGCYIEAFEVVGERFGHGFDGSWCGGNISFNLHGKYSKMTFVCGMTTADSDYKDYEPEVKIYADGNEISNNIWPKWNKSAEKYSIDLNQCKLIKFDVPYYVGIGNIVVYK